MRSSEVPVPCSFMSGQRLSMMRMELQLPCQGFPRLLMSVVRGHAACADQGDVRAAAMRE